MAKGKKKGKKDLDFQKVKLKVGRRLKKDSNETKAEFKTRKIILKEVRSHSIDPITALARHSDHISQHGKISLLNHFNSALTHEVVRTLTKPILDSLAKFIVDHSDQVRAAAIKCLKTCYNQIKQQKLSTKDFMYSLRPYLNCAFTHVSAPITSDCHKLIEYFVNINDPMIFEPLMEIILHRCEAGNLTQSHKDLATKLKHYHLREKQKQTIDNLLRSDKIEPLIWTEKDYFINVDCKLHNLHGDCFDWDREVQLGTVLRKENIVEKYLQLDFLNQLCS